MRVWGGKQGGNEVEVKSCWRFASDPALQIPVALKQAGILNVTKLPPFSRINQFQVGDLGRGCQLCRATVHTGLQSEMPGEVRRQARGASLRGNQTEKEVEQKQQWPRYASGQDMSCEAQSMFSYQAIYPEHPCIFN